MDKKTCYTVLIAKNGEKILVCNRDAQLLKHMSITVGSGYARVRKFINRTDNGIQVHKIIMGQMPDSKTVTDHINENKLDNRRCNLRIVDRRINSLNTSKPRKNNSGYRGVWHDKRNNSFDAYCTFKGKRKYIGNFKTAIDAAKARDEYFAKVHGEFPTLNFKLPKSSP